MLNDYDFIKRCTERAKHCINLATRLASESGQSVSPEHLFLALLSVNVKQLSSILHILHSPEMATIRDT